MTAYEIPDPPKALRETLCEAQALVGAGVHADRLARLVGECDRHRPLGRDGVHGDLHTATCGCEDKGEVFAEAPSQAAVELAHLIYTLSDGLFEGDAADQTRRIVAGLEPWLREHDAAVQERIEATFMRELGALANRVTQRELR